MKIPKLPRLGLFRAREVPVPTWRGWLVLAALIALAVAGFLHAAYPFLAPNRPVPGGILVAEGWSADYVLQRAVDEARGRNYERVVVTGGPIEFGAPLSEYKTYAERGAAVLCRMGLSSNVVYAVPAAYARQDRTYLSAVALKQWFEREQLRPDRVNLVTSGTHARRSSLLFRRALGRDIRVGVVAVPPAEYDPKRWWRYSAGVRAVVGEFLAYGYARFVFDPPAEPAPR